MPFPSGSTQGAALAEYLRRTAAHARYAPDVIGTSLRSNTAGSTSKAGSRVTHPVLVLAGRHDRTCAVGASQDMALRLPNAQLVIFRELQP